ncbi:MULTISPECIES: hypothetical protein [Chromobacterium]|uniref:protein MIGRI n=2 Tax=Chromobacteriaceae TaxID=1499392 RepID=UPI001D05CE1D|nr:MULTISPECIES: hypothetical protein [Chromobacterium]MCP1290170.1 hypothetical protein [Chromobacterium sp. S0633]
MSFAAGDSRLASRGGAPDNRATFFRWPAMFGRLFKFFVLCGVLLMLARWLLNRRQRQSLHELFSTLALALLLSAGLFSLLYLLGWHRL